jgi:hypothetical protein
MVLSAVGELKRARALGSGEETRTDSLDTVVALADGGFVLAGATDAKGAGQKDGWLLRTDSELTILWDTALGEPLDDEFHTLAALPEGGFVVAGSTASRPEGDPRRVRPGAEIETRLWIARLGYR